MSEKLQTKVTGTGFWASVLLVILTIAFIVSVVATYYVNRNLEWWGGVQKAPLTFYVSLIIAFLSAILTVILLVSAHYYAPEDKKIYSHMAVLFATIGVVLLSINYYVQLTVVRPHLLHETMEGLEMFVFQNTGSLMFAVDIIGAFFMGLALFFIAPVFGNGTLELFIRWFLVLTGLASVAGVVGHVLDEKIVLIVCLGVMSLFYLISNILLTVMFTKAESRMIKDTKTSITTAAVAETA